MPVPSDPGCEHMFVKPIEREEARRMRRDEGRSIREIAARLGVSPSSVSRWVSDITLAPGFIEALRQRDPTVNGRLSGVRAQCAARRAARLASQQDGRDRARDPTRLHLAGCMLYWAEGSKGRNAVKLTNSDPDMLTLFVRFLRDCYAVPPERIALSVNCHLNNGLELARDRTVVAGSPRAPGVLIAGCVSQPHVYGVSLATERSRLRDCAGERRLHSNRAKHLWRHPAIRWD